MSSIYKILETYEKSNKISQATKEEDIAIKLGKHYRQVNELYNQLKYTSEKQKLEDNARIMGLQEKLKLLQEETNKNLRQCAELEDLVNSYKDKLNENQQKAHENTLFYEKQLNSLKKSHNEEIQALRAKMEKMEILEQLSKDGHSSPLYDCETANTSFQDCLPFEKESKVESLIQKIETFITKNGDGASILEGQVEKLQKQLSEAKEQCIVDRQMARNANLNVWKLEKQISDLENEKKTIIRKLDYANSHIDTLKDKISSLESNFVTSKKEVLVKENVVSEIKENMERIRKDKDLERDLRIKYEQTCVKQKSDIAEYKLIIKTLEEKLSSETQMLSRLQRKNDELISEQQKLQYKLSKIDDACSNINNIVASKTSELEALRKNYEMLKKACLITDKQVSELENRLKKETDLRIKYLEKCRELEIDVNARSSKISDLTSQLTQEKKMREKAETAVSLSTSETEKKSDEIKVLQEKLNEIGFASEGKSTQITKLKVQVEQLSNETLGLRELIKIQGKEINDLKEDNTKVLSELFMAREENESHKQAQDEADKQLHNLMKDINFKEGIIEEQKNCQTKMDVKSTTMIAQYKKMIEFLQTKVEASEKKKKGITGKLFG